MGEDHPNNEDGRVVERVTIAEAATLLGCHPNTVRSRVKAGMYRAEKVHTENGPTWMIDLDSVTAKTPTSKSQKLVGKVPEEALLRLAREIVREAGLQVDPEEEAAEKRHQRFIEGGREHWKAQVDFFKHMATVSGATLVAVTALTGLLLPREVSTASAGGTALTTAITSSAFVYSVIAAASFLGAAGVALVGLFWASNRLVKFSWGEVPTREEASAALISSFFWPRGLVYFLFALGITALGGLVFEGWPTSSMGPPPTSSTGP